MTFATLSIAFGFGILIWRLSPVVFLPFRTQSTRLSLGYSTDIKVSLIVPCRNEERNLPGLLRTLSEETWPHLEIIFVDDNSTDQTSQLLREFARQKPNAKLISLRQKPEGWAGKNWACHQGALNASGEILIFTDADTRHEPNGMARVVAAMRRESLDVVSVVPSHLTPTWWEKGMGLFYLFTFAAGNAFHPPAKNRYYAIGQYFAFRRSWYERVGHAAIHDFLSEDMELVKRTLAEGGAYQLMSPGLMPIYRVRMYGNFAEFLAGWRRIFRLGFEYSHPLAFFEIYFLIAFFALNFSWSSVNGWVFIPWILGLWISYQASLRWGDFPFWGILLWPFALIVFIGLSIAALFDQVFHRQFQWRDRAYSASQIKSET